MADLSYLDAVILGVVEGLTEYLPVSSTGHLTITEKLLGLEVSDPAVTAYTAVIQLGAILAVLVHYRQLLWERTSGLFRRESASVQPSQHAPEATSAHSAAVKLPLRSRTTPRANGLVAAST